MLAWENMQSETQGTAVLSSSELEELAVLEGT